MKQIKVNGIIIAENNSNDFDKMVQQKIEGIRLKQKESVKIINDIFMTVMNNEEPDIESLSDTIYQKLMGE